MPRDVAGVLLNIDAGELPDEPSELYALAHIVSVACGGHAGDDASMDRVLAFCSRFGTRVGAHPSYADKEGFGRKNVSMDPALLETLVADQCGRLLERARSAHVRVDYVKPHGALYHAADADAAAARAVVRGAVRALGSEIAVIGPANGELRRAAEGAGVGYLRERFCDRGMRADGTLIPRGEPGALGTDPAKAAARAAGIVRDADAETACVHGDTSGAVDIARAVRHVLDGFAVPVRLGDAAWRWSIGPNEDRRALLETLRALPGVTDAVVTEEHACIVCREGARPNVPSVATAVARAQEGREHVVRVRYDGADLSEIAAHAQMDAAEVVRRHSARTYIVSMVGFMPGFGYLREVDPSIGVPRRASPRTRVPAGSVGIAAGYTGIYPFASPGGWNLIGTAVDFMPFDAEHGAKLAVGDRVRFEPAP